LSNGVEASGQEEFAAAFAFAFDVLLFEGATPVFVIERERAV
jgi:hypothetical protein